MNLFTILWFLAFFGVFGKGIQEAVQTISLLFGFAVLILLVFFLVFKLVELVLAAFGIHAFIAALI